ncbi:tRNA dihydrouridine(20/20a) synthase DusA [Amphritea balenae]|uniref:tRNA-dihydrouridine(20/20a) synthase n=1 Tax=Amphritea balenae TaxID=452629 RepID=A0A3P1SVX0_9GAMM|nr:tRNA dihydrouridine(20/20a) synthase DusA [Amphritea balenae]RRD01344.1 tRNA dihydrouridine(20/20a) synthase DusA [Amphritea balenae]GGK57919.1 tRNA-dihydrouridine(20/20a) synthase [Amphritea balenae]
MSDYSSAPLKRTFCVAPMMEWTDRHCRYFHRLISQNAVLYTEMVTTGALIHGDNERFLRFNPEEQPVALQLGGSNPEDLTRCTRMAEDFGYNEVNLNVGCPSDRVQNNMIGACLMAHPQLVAECLYKMQQAVAIPVTVKHRLGIDDMDSYEQLYQFVATVSESGCKTFIIHARKAILKGLSPKENRDIPPLKYEWAYKIKQEFPDLEILINGGIKTLEECRTHLQHTDGVMVGREAYHNPYMMAEVDALYNPDAATKSRIEIIEQMYPYIEEQLRQGVFLGHMTRHLLGLFHAQRGGRQFRRYLSENAHRTGADVDVLKQAVAKVTE